MASNFKDLMMGLFFNYFAFNLTYYAHRYAAYCNTSASVQEEDENVLSTVENEQLFFRTLPTHKETLLNPRINEDYDERTSM